MVILAGKMLMEKLRRLLHKVRPLRPVLVAFSRIFNVRDVFPKIAQASSEIIGPGFRHILVAIAVKKENGSSDIFEERLW